jgi:hypothetical protein
MKSDTRTPAFWGRWRPGAGTPRSIIDIRQAREEREARERRARIRAENNPEPDNAA